MATYTCPCGTKIIGTVGEVIPQAQLHDHLTGHNNV